MEEIERVDQINSVIEGAAAQMNSVIFHVIQDEAGSIQVIVFKICVCLMLVLVVPQYDKEQKSNDKQRTLYFTVDKSKNKIKKNF